MARQLSPPITCVKYGAAALALGPAHSVTVPRGAASEYRICVGRIISASVLPYAPVQLISGLLKISLAGANNSVPTTGLTPCIIIVHVYTCYYSGAKKKIDVRWQSLAL